MENSPQTCEIKIGNAVIEFEIPASLYKSIQKTEVNDEKIRLYSHHSDALINIARSLIPEESRPASHKQESYALKIASTLKIKLPEEVLETSSACSQFIESNVEQFQEADYQIRVNRMAIKAEIKEHNQLASLATKVNKWHSAFVMITDGLPIEEVADSFGVKPPTIKKYCDMFNEWKEEAIDDNTFYMIFEIIDKIRAGDDVFLEYDNSY